MSKTETLPLSAAAAMERGETPETYACERCGKTYEPAVDETLCPDCTAAQASRLSITEYLEGLNSHSIYDADKLSENFVHQVGLPPCWPVHSHASTKRAIQNRGLGGELTDDPAPSAYGWEIAEALATKYAAWEGTAIMGRGGRFRAAYDALKKAGR